IFSQRCINSALLVYSLISREYHEWIIKITQPQFYDSIEPLSIVFVNSNHITEQSRPVPPNFIPIGGIHLSQPKNILKVKMSSYIFDYFSNTPYNYLLQLYIILLIISIFYAFIFKIYKSIYVANFHELSPAISVGNYQLSFKSKGTRNTLPTENMFK
ncbi:UDP-glucuronosyltransferase 2B2-like isoform X1, partial [Aphis craccivora]